jgi:hypothetical protein
MHRDVGGWNQLSLVSSPIKADAEATRVDSALEATWDCLGQKWRK